MISKPNKLPNPVTSVALAVFCMLAFCSAPAAPCWAQAENEDSGQWVQQNPEGANAEFEMPVEPRDLERSFRPVANQPSITVKQKICSMDQGQIVFVFSYHDLHELPQSRVEIQEILDGAVKGSVARVIGQLQNDEKVSLREHPGRKISYDFNFNGQALKSESEIYLIGSRQYVLNTIFKASNIDTALSEKFFDSFNPFSPEETVQSDLTGDAVPLDSTNGFDISDGEMPVELK